MSVGQGATEPQGGTGTQPGQAPEGQSGQQGSGGGQGSPGGQSQSGGQAGTQQDWDGPYDPERARRTIDQLREELRGRPSQADYQTLQQKLTELERAEMNEAQRTAAERDDWKTRAEKAEQALAEREATQVVAEVAATLQFHNPASAHKMINVAALDRDKDGRPKKDAVEKALRVALETDPWLAKPQPGDGGAGRGTSPGSAPGGSGGSDMNALIRRGAGRST